MSTQTYDTNVTYCSSCQTLSQYAGWDVQISACAAAYEHINEEFYNQAANRINNLHDFGDHDSVTREPAKLNKSKNSGTIVEEDYYNDIASRILSTYTPSKDGDTIYGSYFNNLKSKVNSKKIADTRYYVCKDQGSKTCCDCDGQCCEGQCSCDGQSAGCRWDIGECYEGCAQFIPVGPCRYD